MNRTIRKHLYINYKITNKVEKNKKQIDIEVSSNEVDHWMKVFSDSELDG